MYNVKFVCVSGWSAHDHLADDLICEAERELGAPGFGDERIARQAGKAALKRARSTFIARGGTWARASQPRVDVRVLVRRAFSLMTKDGMFMGTYEGATVNQALLAMYRAEGYGLEAVRLEGDEVVVEDGWDPWPAVDWVDVVEVDPRPEGDDDV